MTFEPAPAESMRAQHGQKGFGWALAALGLFPLACLALPLVRGAIPYYMDIVAHFYPMRMHAAALIQGGEMPFWNRTMFAGVPLLANPQAGLLYPGHWPLLALPGPLMFTLLNALHLAWGGMGVFFWVRAAHRGRAVLGPLLAGLLMQAGGWSWAHLAFGSYIAVASLLPWILCALERYCERPRRVWLLLAGGAGAMQWLAGAPQMALYCLGAVWVYAGALWGVERLGMSDGPQKMRAQFRSSGPLRSLVFFLAVQFLLALGLSAPQWMTTRAFLAECERAGKLPLSQVMAGALDGGGILRAWFGGTGVPEDAEQILYPGSLAMLLAAWGALLAIGSCGRALRNRRKASAPESGSALAPPVGSALAALCMLVVAVLLTWKPLVPLLHQYAPPFGYFHDPRRILLLGYGASIFLAGVGAQAILAGLRKRTGRQSSAKKMPLIFAVFLGILLLGAVADPLMFSKRRVDIRHVPAREIVEEAPQEAFGMARGQRFFAQDMGIQYSYNYTRANFGRTLLPNLAALYGFEDIQGYDPFIPWRYAVAMRRVNAYPVRAVTLYPHHFGLVRNADSPWLSRFGAVQAWGYLDCQWPFFAPQWLKPGESMQFPLAPDWPVGKLADVRVYLAYQKPSRGASSKDSGGALALKFVDETGEVGALEARPTLPEAAPADGIRLLDNVWPSSGNISFVARAAVVETGPPPQDGRSARTIIAENRGQRPLLLYSIGLPEKPMQFEPALPSSNQRSISRFAPVWTEDFPAPVALHGSGAAGMGNRQERELFEKWALGLSPAMTHIEVPEGLSQPGSIPSQTIQGWRFVSKRANRLRIALPARHEGGWLALSEPFFPGWKCKVDGQPVPLYAADVWFRAIPVIPGARLVEMRYFPPGLAQGIALAGAAALAALLLLLRRERQRNEPGLNTPIPSESEGTPRCPPI